MGEEIGGFAYVGPQSAGEDGGETVGEGHRGIFADEAAEDGAVAVENDVGWQRIGAVAVHLGAVRVKALRPVHSVLRDEIAPGSLVVVLADADYLEPVASVSCLKLLQIGQRLAARAAPGGPEIEESDFSSVPRGRRTLRLALRNG